MPHYLKSFKGRQFQSTASRFFRSAQAIAQKVRRFFPELPTMMLSAAHSYGDLELVAQTFSESLQEMIRDRFFVF